MVAYYVVFSVPNFGDMTYLRFCDTLLNIGY